MNEMVVQGLDLLINGLEFCGASFMILGFIVATSRWLKTLGREDHPAATRRYRQALARSILIGLEVMLAATIIKTITLEPSLREVGILAGVIIVRTLLGWTTALEANGRWPWQRPRQGT